MERPAHGAAGTWSGRHMERPHMGAHPRPSAEAFDPDAVHGLTGRDKEP